MDRLCYTVRPSGPLWEVRTEAPWPDALVRWFSSREEAITVATIAAKVEWKQGRRATCVCSTDPKTGQMLVEATFG